MVTTEATSRVREDTDWNDTGGKNCQLFVGESGRLAKMARNNSDSHIE